MKKLIKDKQQFLSDMLEGIKIAHPELEVINDNVVVKDKNNWCNFSVRWWEWS